MSELQSYSSDYDAKETPIALRMAHEVMTLPLYAGLSREDIDRIVKVIKRQ